MKFIVDDDANVRLRKMYKENIGFRVRNATVRASPAYIARHLSMHERTVYLFLSRFMNALPQFRPTRHITGQWFRGVRNGDEARYSNLFYAIETSGSVKTLLQYCIQADTCADADSIFEKVK